MAQYYVVRDKNTGLYFRGKGANRWGKHYNQASIYRVRKMAENTIKEVSWHGEQAEVVPIQIIEGNADVVEVVRCKDCLYAHFNSSSERYSCQREYPRRSVQEDDFCNYGKVEE